MTTSLQPRIPAGAPGGGRFAPAACRTAYAVLDALAATLDSEVQPDPGGHRIEVPAPRCAHGHFARWASRNCCAPTAAPAGGPAGGAAGCEGSTATGEQCTRRTTRRDRTGRPACHLHGGHATPAV